MNQGMNIGQRRGHVSLGTPSVDQTGQRDAQIRSVTGVEQMDQTRAIQSRVTTNQPGERLDMLNKAIVSVMQGAEARQPRLAIQRRASNRL